MSGATWVFRALVLALVVGQIQADAAPPRKKKEVISLKVEETVGDLAFVQQISDIKVMGIGLVTGLENTGADPPPSWERGQLVDEMSKAGVEHPSKLLANPQFSMVIVKMTIHAGASPKDRFDVEVEVPPACGTKSLAGGYLMATRLARDPSCRWSAAKRQRPRDCSGPRHDRQRQESQQCQGRQGSGRGQGQERVAVHADHQ